MNPPDVPAGTIPAEYTWKHGDYSEGLFEKLGAETVTSFDASDFEGATVVHDFNEPLPAEHRGRYSFMFDGGSIEHILSPAQVIANHNASLRVGGHLLIGTQCNGSPAHGFYQLSPEFFYSVLCKANGFEDTQVYLVDVKRDRWHLAADPAVLGDRIRIPPTVIYDIFAVTRKTSDVQRVVAQQSDYLARWANQSNGRGKKRISNWRYRFRNKYYGRFLDESPLFTPETY